MKKRLQIRVSGRVQGVFFRDSTRMTAKRLGITGLARNEPDGTVYVEAEGAEDDLDEFVSWLKEGSPAARVDNLDIEETAPEDSSEFKITD